MSLSEVQTEILEPMQRLYLPPRLMLAEVQTEALKGYGDVLKGFAAADLHDGWTEVVASHTSRSWPVPGVIVLAVRKAAKERRSESGEPASRFSRQVIDYTANRQRWEQIRCSQMAREAANGGFSWSMKCRVLNDSKLAEQIDIRELSAEHNSAEHTAESLRKGERVWNRFSEKWVEFTEDNAAIALKMHRTLLIREAETAEEIRRAAKPVHLVPA